MNIRKIIPLLIIPVFLSLSACSNAASVSPTLTYTPESIPPAQALTDEITITASPTPTTELTMENPPLDIMIDGKGADWENYPFAIVEDDLNDQNEGAADFASAMAFNTDEYFYLAINFAQNGDTAQFVVNLVFKDEAYMVSFTNNNRGGPFSLFGYVKTIDGSEKLGAHKMLSGLDEMVEFKIPLSIFNDQPVQEAEIYTWLDQERGEGDRIRVPSVPYLSYTEREIPHESVYALEWHEVDGLHGTIAEPGYAFERVYDAPVTPFVVKVSPEGNILLLGHEFDCIYELKEDGTTELYATFPFELWYFNFDPQGRLWVFGKNNRYFYVDENGYASNVTNGLRPVFIFDSRGNMYASGTSLNDIFKLTTDFEASILAEGIQMTGVMRNLAVTPDDELLVRDAYGNLFLVRQDGSRELLTDQMAQGESGMLFGPDGWLYNIGQDRLLRFNMDTREVERLTWYDKYAGSGYDLEFDKDGRLIIYHGNHPVQRVDLENQSVEVIYNNMGETWALAVSPDQQVFAAYGNRLPDGESTLYRIENGVLVPVFTIPYGIPGCLAIGQDGIGYLGAADHVNGAVIYSFDTQTGNYEVFYQTEDYWPTSISINPLTNLPSWTGSAQVIYHMTGSGDVNVEDGLPQTWGKTILTYAPDGTLYLGEEFQKLYRREEDGTWTLLYEHSNMGTIHLHALAVGPDGSLYMAANHSGEIIPGGRDYGSTASVLRVDGYNNITLLGYDFPFDMFSIAVDPVNGDIYFSNSDGIFRLYVE